MNQETSNGEPGRLCDLCGKAISGHWNICAECFAATERQNEQSVASTANAKLKTSQRTRRITAALWAIAGGLNDGLPKAVCWAVVTAILVDLIIESAYGFYRRVQRP